MEWDLTADDHSSQQGTVVVGAMIAGIFSNLSDQYSDLVLMRVSQSHFFFSCLTDRLRYHTIPAASFWVPIARSSPYVSVPSGVEHSDAHD